MQKESSSLTPSTDTLPQLTHFLNWHTSSTDTNRSKSHPQYIHIYFRSTCVSLWSVSVEEVCQLRKYVSWGSRRRRPHLLWYVIDHKALGSDINRWVFPSHVMVTQQRVYPVLLMTLPFGCQRNSIGSHWVKSPYPLNREQKMGFHGFICPPTQVHAHRCHGWAINLVVNKT